MDKEKLNTGLECCIVCAKTHVCPAGCPYAMDEGVADGLTVHCDGMLLMDAQLRIRELEAARTARVMTLEEVKKHYSLPPVVLDDLCWQEDYLQDIEPLYFDFPVEDSLAVHWRGYQSVRKYLEDWTASYGQKWRCWTQRPTDEQREAAAWTTD